ncbi:hypothetical protein MC885_007780 [Smutsia gigantea]|nr:hypothetical protein MC885_007780 [Smutsia gigantea]
MTCSRGGAVPKLKQELFLVFGSCSKTTEMLTGTITHQPGVGTLSLLRWPYFHCLHKDLLNHDLVFQCGSDGTTDNKSGVTYVSVKPDNRKLASGTNVLGLLIDALLMEFCLVSTRTVPSGDKPECYSFERIKRSGALTMNKTLTLETTIMPEQAQKKKQLLCFLSE